MNEFMMVFGATIRLILSALSTGLFLRAILSWFPIENRFVDFVDFVTEPIILPFRLLFEKLNWFQGLPIDMAFFFAMITLSFLELWVIAV